MKVYQDPFWQVTAAILFVVIAMGFAGTSDLEEAQRQEAEYCENVANKVWPDYAGKFSEVCPKNRPAKTGYTAPQKGGQ